MTLQRPIGAFSGDEASPIAIVSMGGALPTGLDLDSLWRGVVNAVDAAKEPPDGRWVLDPDLAYDEERGRTDRVYSRRACFVDEPTLDLDGVALERELVERLDPSVRLALAAGLQAWRGGQTAELESTRVGVILGNIALPTETTSAMAEWMIGRDFEHRLARQSGSPLAPDDRLPVEERNLWALGLPASILARALGLGGPSWVLDAACASSLFAVAHAARELRAGRLDAVLTGGLSRPDALYTQMGFSQLLALSPSGRCSPFDRKSDGLVVGEGAGVFLLKRLDDALRHGDRIHAVVRSVGLSNDRDGNLLAPSQEGQLRAMRSAYRRAGWRPQDVDLIECHATGTPIGDRTEAASLRALWGEGDWQPGQCVLGSVKSNVGHLLTGAGAAGLLKTVLAMQHQVLPPTANFEAAADGIDLARGPFRVLAGAEEWPSRDRSNPQSRRRAAVSGFGFGGTNAHLLIEEWRESGADTVLVSPEVAAPPPAAVEICGLGAWLGAAHGGGAFRRRVLGGEVTPPEPKRPFGSLDDAPRGWFLERFEVPLGAFRIPPRELLESLPQQVLMLQVAKEALEDAGLLDESGRLPEVLGLDTGIFVGATLDLSTTDFHLRWALESRLASGLDSLEGTQRAALRETLLDALAPPLTANRTVGSLGGIVASRVAREFGAGGPCYVLGSEEASGLTALEAALRALQAGEIRVAVVGGVDLRGDLRSRLAEEAILPPSVDGQVLAFDRGATGGVPGEGAVALILRRRDLEAGRPAYAALRGVGSATGGRAHDLYPDEAACRRAIEAAYQDARVDPRSVAVIEGHASGRPSEDRVEARALEAMFSPSTVITGAAEAIGLTGAAGALASVAKGALALHHRIVPPLHGENTRDGGDAPHRPRLALARRPLPSYWLAGESPVRRLGVNTLSVTGLAGHAVLEEVGTTPGRSRRGGPPTGDVGEALFLFEAVDRRELRQQLVRLDELAQGLDTAGSGSAAVEELARRLWCDSELPPRGGDRERLRLALIARDPGDLTHRIRRTLSTLDGGGFDQRAQSTPRVGGRVFFSRSRLVHEGGLAFVYPGSGSHWRGMGRDLAATFPVVMAEQERQWPRLDQHLHPELAWFPAQAADEDPSGDVRGWIAAQSAFSCLVTDLLAHFGVRPSSALGYSLGETAALVALGIWPRRDELHRRLVTDDLFTHWLAGDYEAARQIWQLGPDEPVDWRVAVVLHPADRVQDVIEASNARCYVLIRNTQQECVIGGQGAAVERIVAELGDTLRPLDAVATVHCEVARAVEDRYRAFHRLETATDDSPRMYSASRGEAYLPTTESCAASVTEQAMTSFDFPRLVERAWLDGVRLFVEIGPGQSCTRMIRSILGDRDHLAHSAAPEEAPGPGALLRLLGALYAEGVRIDLAPLYGERGSTGSRRIETSRAAGAPAEAALTRRGDARLARQSLELTIGRVPFGDVSAVWPSAPSSPTLPRGTQSHPLPARGTSMETASDSRATASATPASATLTRREVAAPVPAPTPAMRRSLTRELCLEFATGSIAAVLGPEFAAVDAHPTRVRLPDEPLMLVDRVLEIEGEPRSMAGGRIVTEHDVLSEGWYLDAGRIPTCVAVEAGQADLFLSSFLGIDFETEGRAVYRLLDAVVTFHDELPRAGDTIHYDIRIERFFRQGDTWLFRFGFDATVDGRPLMTMRDGCAGFFTEQELAAGQGIVRGATLERRMAEASGEAAKRVQWVPLARESFGSAALDALREGRLGDAFGEAFEKLDVARPLTIPGGRMRMVHRVTEIDPEGGARGLGSIRAEADIRPDDWFLTCHFVDDRVMPGTLMYECCMHTLRVMLLRMGWVASQDDGAVWQPIPGIRSRLKCRGQVLESTRTVTYEIQLKEMGTGAHPGVDDPQAVRSNAPWAVCDALMYADGKPIVEITDMSVRLTGVELGTIDRLWARAHSTEVAAFEETPVRYDRTSIEAFASGNPSDAFGEPYAVFDVGRRIARLPRDPYQFLDRVIQVSGEPFVMQAGAACEAEVAIEKGAWFFSANRQREIPFAILLEIALQPCGWLAAYCGSALTSSTDLRFRNLGGAATLHAPVEDRPDVLTTRVSLDSVSSSGGMIIQHYTFEVTGRQVGRCYSGTTYFGFFSAEALANQVGIRGIALPGSLEGRSFDLPTEAPFPERQLRMVDRVDSFLPEGGPHGLGSVIGSIEVDPTFWFFDAHFYQDPVWPGSLGLEAFLQLLKVVAHERWGVQRFSTMALGNEHRWQYRGQVVPTDSRVEIHTVVTALDDQRRVVHADGYLTVDGRVIYEMRDFALQAS